MDVEHQEFSSPDFEDHNSRAPPRKRAIDLQHSPIPDSTSLDLSEYLLDTEGKIVDLRLFCLGRYRVVRTVVGVLIRPPLEKNRIKVQRVSFSPVDSELEDPKFIRPFHTLPWEAPISESTIGEFEKRSRKQGRKVPPVRNMADIHLANVTPPTKRQAALQASLNLKDH